jgi:sec-independent protein translocase protein TatA
MEILLIFLAILLIFGAKRIPEIARGMGKGIKEFRSATREISSELSIDDRPRERVQQPRQPVQGTPEPRVEQEPAVPGSATESKTPPAAE